MPGEKGFQEGSRREAMGIVIFGAGTIVGIFLGIAFISLLGMAQEADKVYDWLDRSKEAATPTDTYSLLPAGTILPTGSGEGRLPRDLSGSVAAH